VPGGLYSPGGKMGVTIMKTSNAYATRPAASFIRAVLAGAISASHWPRCATPEGKTKSFKFTLPGGGFNGPIRVISDDGKKWTRTPSFFSRAT
jgi:hypothetical protein